MKHSLCSIWSLCTMFSPILSRLKFSELLDIFSLSTCALFDLISSLVKHRSIVTVDFSWFALNLLLRSHEKKA